jgi:hypothetical protein
MSNSDINLIRKDVSSSRKFSVLEEKLRLVSVWFLGGVFVIGIAIGTAYLYISLRVRSLEATKVTLAQQINLQSAKEGILLSLKERTSVAGRALEVAKPWGKMFTVLQEIASEAQYNSLTVDDTGKVTTTLFLGSIDESVSVVLNLVRLVNERMLRTPQLLSFSYKEDATVQMTISFFPVF